MAEKEKSKLTVQLPKSLHKKFKITAAERDDVMGKLIEQWIEAYVAGKKKPASR